jgi:hypothetical protein
VQRLEHRHRTTANPQIAYDKELATSFISTAVSYRKIRSQMNKILSL